MTSTPTKLQKLESDIMSSDRNINSILEIMDMLTKENKESGLAAINALRRIFTAQARKGNMHTASSSSARDRVRTWLRNQFSDYSKCLMDMIKQQGRN